MPVVVGVQAYKLQSRRRSDAASMRAWAASGIKQVAAVPLHALRWYARTVLCVALAEAGEQ